MSGQVTRSVYHCKRCDPKRLRNRVKVYQDRNDWWVGYYRGDTHHYVCPLPTLVIRWRRS